MQMREAGLAEDRGGFEEDEKPSEHRRLALRRGTVAGARPSSARLNVHDRGRNNSENWIDICSYRVALGMSPVIASASRRRLSLTMVIEG